MARSPRPRQNRRVARDQHASLTADIAGLEATEAEAQELHASGVGAEVLQDPLRRARELLAVIDAELAANGLHMPPDVRDGLEQLRTELAQLQSGPATMH